MLLDRYDEHVDALIAKLRSSQRENFIAAGKIMADTIATGNAVHIHDSGHIVNWELCCRGGGFMCIKPLIYEMKMDNRIRPRDKSDCGIPQSMEGFAEFAIRAANVVPGDLIIVGSVSGISEYIVDLALTAKKYGCKIIALTSIEYSSSVKSRHSSGKHLYECADVVIDNCAPVAEGMMKVEGLEPPFAAASGITATLALWSVCTVALEELLARGITPSVYKSANYPGGNEYNEAQEKIYNETGI